MFVLRGKEGAKIPLSSWPSAERSQDVSGLFFRHTYHNTDGWWTNDLQKAKVYNTERGAKSNWDSDLCEVVEVKVELA